MDDFNNLLLQNAQMANQVWNQMPIQGDSQLQPMLQNEIMNITAMNKDVNPSKSPWTTSEEHIF